MRKLITSLFLLFIVSVIVLSCKKKKDDPTPETPQDPNETEVITTLKLILTESSSSISTTFMYRDLDGDGGNGPVQFDNITLLANKNYTGKIILLDETKNPVDSTSNEVYEERDAHQFFYTVTGANLSPSYMDYDTHGVPVGLFPSFTTGSVGTGTLKVTLKHQPGVKPLSGVGDITKGETDVEVTFNVTIQ